MDNNSANTSKLEDQTVLSSFDQPLNPPDCDKDERSNEQSAMYAEEVELTEMFDMVLLCTYAKAKKVINSEIPSEVEKSPNNAALDLKTLLTSCAQSVASGDQESASEKVKQIRQESSPTGDTYQRLATIFADGLEARLSRGGATLFKGELPSLPLSLEGTAVQPHAALTPKRMTNAADNLKAYHVHLSSCPFIKVSMSFANKMIFQTAHNSTTLHIIDFGIRYGFQWPILIQHLSMMPHGPPKLRITGIDLPQPGFRPAEGLEETGCRLARYCKRFNIPFEYNAIAIQNWERIKIKDLKLGSGEFVAVNCLFRFENLSDETVDVECPRDAVLTLIRELNPDIFVQSVTNASYNSPFFVTLFQEALLHYSTLFDMFDATLPRDDQQRLHFEQELCRREAINVIACEGAERVERPETYEQWQVRNVRAGFKILPLNQQVMKTLQDKVEAGYHRDFVLYKNGNWMLQGWKDRIICASSCWIPLHRSY
ncbi:scarecrow-like protein 14 isoform X2 [Solanum dulcamara]|uniref:scarecrow-like protein 14 isoform X2 n=1 Tax=Solanum dulcamara TaxID=45834 RepID=UPI002485C7FB|nr:scarecrow-like protein 14 isoform X2 [Solanum dulcamara]